jgi:2-hydroxy-3-keto-5-methylthiopentenyl-1-phosphate phosphatase
MTAATEHQIPKPKPRAPGREFRPVIFSDFDGTIAQVDVTDAILSEFAATEWRDVEEDWVAGRIGSRECLRRQTALIRASAGDLNALIDSIPLDPGFFAFRHWTREHHVPFYVVSDGFDYVISRVLSRCGFEGDFLSGSHMFASAMRVGDGTVAVDFPYWPEPCVHGCATCKHEVIGRLAPGYDPVIFIGDGLSDRFAVEAADLVFAKDKLLRHCRDHGTAATPFSTFADIELDLQPLVHAGTDRRVDRRRRKRGQALAGVGKILGSLLM